MADFENCYILLIINKAMIYLLCNANMMKEDARKLSPSAQEERRKLAIKLWKKGNLIKEVAETVGVSANAVSSWIKRYKSEGPGALKAKNEAFLPARRDT